MTVNRILFLILITLCLAPTVCQAQTWTLKECIARAWDQNIDIQRAALNYELDAVSLKQNQYGRLPSLNAGATHGYNWGQTIDPFTNSFATDRVRNNNLFLQSDVTLFNGFSISNSIKQADIDVQASEQDLVTAQNNIGLLVAQGYLNILFNKEQLRSTAAQLDISNRQVERMQRMVEVGQEPQVRLYDVQSQYASDVLAQTQVENALVIAKLNLANLLLLSPEEASNFDVASPSESSFDINKKLLTVAQIYATATGALPQIKAAELRTESSTVGMAVAKGARSPSIGIRGSVGTGYSGANQFGTAFESIPGVPIGSVATSGDAVISAPRDVPTAFDTKAFDDQLTDNFNQSLTLSLNIPILNGLQATSNVSRAKLNYELAKLNEQGTRNQLLQDVQQAHADAIAAKRSYEAASLALEAATQNFDASESRFEQGLINTVDFNDSKSRLALAEVQSIRAKYDYIFRMTIIDFYLGQTINID